MTQHEVHSKLTADEIEAQAEPFVTFSTSSYFIDQYTVGDGVILTSADGSVFIGEVDEIEEHVLRVTARLY